MESSTNNKALKPWPLGRKAKIGVLMPAVDTGYCSYEFQVLCPEGVVTLETRVAMGALTLENLQKMRGDAIYGAKLLAAAKPDVITYEATAAGFVLGVDGDAALIKEMEETTGLRATTGASSVAVSLEALGVKRLSVFAATPKEVTDYTVRYLTDRGFSVLQQQSATFSHASECFELSPWEIKERLLAFHQRCPEVDGVFISGGCFRTLEMLAAFEKETGLPVLSTVPANMYNCLKIAGVKDPVTGFGRLMELPR
jgi:maleate cis-trans isomerase